MMTKIQKIWMWVFGAMFALPEILFLNIMSFVIYFLGGSIPTIFSLISNGYHISPTYFLIILSIEIFGVLGLFILSIKFNRRLFAVLLGIIFLWLVFIFCFIKAFSQINF